MSREKYFAQPSVMSAQQHFSQVPKANIQRSKFDRSHGLKTTFDASYLIPIYCDEVLPGDTFSMSQTAFARLATPLKPIMDNIYLDTQYFFVPYRLIWDNWQEFMGERKNPDDDPSIYTIPVVSSVNNTNTSGTIWDYFGLPIGVNNLNNLVSALPFRAYNLIWNEWYRDQNLQDRVPEPTGDGPDNYQTQFGLLKRGKRHDYFTSCLPWPQKGDPVFIPIGDQADVIVDPATDGIPIFEDQAGTPNLFNMQTAAANNIEASAAVVAGQGVEWNDPKLIADLQTATSISINELRTAFQIQKLLERDARGGTRYIELILSHFGVHSPDARLQRPEFLGGGSQRISINPVAQTTNLQGAVEDPSPQGNLAATGTGVSKAGFKKSFTEHGIIIGLISARADLTYQQGINRMWFRQTRYDFYWPTLAHLGEQAVLNKEIYAQAAAEDDDVFGYQERYAEYRYKPSQITGKFRSNDPESLDIWHLSQDFSALPTLSASFIEEDPPIDRVIAVQDEPHFLADFWFSLYCDRPMPVYSEPGFVDHF
jgi:hypothetical protein